MFPVKVNIHISMSCMIENRQTLSLDDSNIRSGFHYSGQPFKHNGYVNDYKNVDSMQDCLKKCATFTECKYVNYKHQYKTCWLKKGMGKYDATDSSSEQFGILRTSSGGE